MARSPYRRALPEHRTCVGDTGCRYDARVVRSRAVVVVTVLTATSVLGWWFGDQRRAVDVQYRVVEVLDGDTIVVRRAGACATRRFACSVSTRRRRTTRPSRSSASGRRRRRTPRRGCSAQVVRLEDDVERRDLYGRRLAYVYVDGARFNDELLRRGYARLLVIDPNHAHAREMLDEELDAEQHRRGLWGAC